MEVKTWTVIGYYADNLQPFATHTEATSPQSAAKQVKTTVALEECLVLVVNGVIEGRHDVH